VELYRCSAENWLDIVKRHSLVCDFMCHVGERGGQKDGACLASHAETLDICTPKCSSAHGGIKLTIIVTQK
jgi:hypothetical protein